MVPMRHRRRTRKGKPTAIRPMGTRTKPQMGLRPPFPLELEVGGVTLRGEIVDAKCYWGVMKPGHTKPHRGCAARCIAGGVPAVLLVRGADGSARTLLLVTEEGETVNDQVGDLVAEPVEISGVLVRQGDLEILRADPADYRRLD